MLRLFPVANENLIMSSLPISSDGELEEIASDGTGTGVEVEPLSQDDLATSAPFDPAQIDVITQLRTVDLLLSRLREGELDLSPEFQRRANLWTIKRKSGLIESMLLRIPIPSLYVSEDEDGNYAVVDGLQRLCAISHFVDAEALSKAVGVEMSPLQLDSDGMQSLQKYGGDSFIDLPRALQRRIRETELTLHVIRPSTPLAVKFNIFSRINQGGLPLTAQEIRNAIFPGKWRSIILKLAQSKEFIGATQGRIRGERMQDLELVLRAVAHHEVYRTGERGLEENLNEFLNNFVEKVSADWSDAKWEKASEGFLKAMRFSRSVFGDIAFRKYSNKYESRKPINKGLFESEAVVLAMRSEPELVELAKRTDEINEGLKKLSQKPEFSSSLLYATGRGQSANARVKMLNEVLDEALNA